MGAISREAFAALVRGLNRAALAAFVADLWAARGFETRVRADGSVLATGPDGRRRLLAVRASGGLPGRRLLNRSPAPPADPDAVIAADPDADATLAADRDADLLGPADLREMALYGIDREDCRHLFETHFDRTFRETENDAGVATPPGGVLFAAVVLAALVAGAVAVAAPLAGTPDGVGDDRIGASVGESSGAAPATTEGERTFRPPTRRNRSYPPGITEGGVEDADALARAHVDAVEGHSYQLDLLYGERVEGEFTGGVHKQIYVSGPTEYVSHIDSVGTVQRRPYLIADRERYADGERLYVRRGRNATGYETRDLDAGDPWSPAGRVAVAARTLLTTRRSDVREYPRETNSSSASGASEQQLYLVDGYGISDRSVRNYDVRALVTAEGQIHYLRARYDVPIGGTTAVVTIGHSRFGAVQVFPPRWYESPDGETSTERTGNESDPTRTAIGG